MEERDTTLDRGSWALVIARGSKALMGCQRPREVTVIGWDYLPDGVMYEVENPSLPEWAHAELMTPILNQTELVLVNLFDGREEPRGLLCLGLRKA